MDEVKRVYEQYKHLNILLGDAEWLGVDKSPMKQCLFDLWAAIEHDCKAPSPPAEAEVQRLRTIIELAKEALGKGWNPIWELECADDPPTEPPKSFIACGNIEEATAYMKARLSHRTPVEMPEVAPPSPMNPPHKCDLYNKETADKKAGSCKGCKVAGCPYSDGYEGPRPV